jgi:hypothetical protein
MEKMDRLIQSEASKFESKYGDLIEFASESLKDKFEYDWTMQDSSALGKALNNWHDNLEIFESDMTTRSQLGPALSSNIGFVAMQYASLPIQYLASVQPIDDASGTIFYRTAIAGTDRGNIAKGDELLGAYGKQNSGINNYMSDTQVKSDMTIADNAGAPKNGPYAFTLTGTLIAGKQSVDIGGKVKAIDDGEGHFIGVGVDADASTINYETGACTITFTALAAKGINVGDTITIVYVQTIVDGADVPSFTWATVSKTVNARYYILQSTYNTLTDHQVKKKFGKDFGTEIASDLVQQSNTAVLIDTIDNLRKSANVNRVNTGNAITWSNVAPTAVSDINYRQTFEDKIIEAVDEMYDIVGKGDASFYITNTKGKQIFKSLGMKTVRTGVTGVHLIGMLDGAPVYYAPSNILAKNEIIVGYRGAQFFESACVHAPYMPLTTETGSVRENVFTKHSGIASASANESLVNGFVQLISITTPAP